jgi:hypothetical protein
VGLSVYFIDKDGDGRIDSAEYRALQDYKKKHADWQRQARRELGLSLGTRLILASAAQEATRALPDPN